MKKIGFRANAIAMKHRNLRDRIVAIEAYGGPYPKCACCDEMEWSLLTLDHIHGGGNVEREKFLMISTKRATLCTVNSDSEDSRLVTKFSV